MTAACAGKWELFDSTDIFDHREAALLCSTCPMLLACSALLENVMASSHPSGRPAGTWAGKLIGAGSLAAVRGDEERAYTDEAARAAHARYIAGRRDEWTVIGHRVWDRRYRRNRSAA